MVEIIVAIVSGVLAGGITPLIFFKQERKSKDIDNSAKMSEEWQKLYHELHNELKERDEKIDSLYAEISKHRDAKAELQQKLTEAQVENTKLKLLKCEVPSCPKRQPPTGF